MHTKPIGAYAYQFTSPGDNRRCYNSVSQIVTLTFCLSNTVSPLLLQRCTGVLILTPPVKDRNAFLIFTKSGNRPCIFNIYKISQNLNLCIFNIFTRFWTILPLISVKKVQFFSRASRADFQNFGVHF